MYRKYMHKYIFASIDWDINISIDFSLPNLKLSRLWRHGADLLRCTVTSPASWSKFQKWRTWESHASSIIFTVRNRLNRTESFQMTEKLIQWKKTSSETRAHSQISHSHSILGGQIFKQIVSISSPRGPPEKTSGVSFLASIHEYVDGAILQCNGHLFAVRPLEGAQDLTHGRLSGRPLAVSVASNGQLWAGKTLWNPTKQDLFGHQICQKRHGVISSLHFWLHVFEWSFEHEHPWDDQGSSDLPEVDFSDASLVIKFLIKSFAAKIRWRLWMWLEKLQPLENSGRWKVQEPMRKIPM